MSTTSRPQPIDGAAYVDQLLRFLGKNRERLSTPNPLLAPSRGGKSSSSFLQQTWTLATLGLDPTSAPLNPTLTSILSLGLASSTPSPTASSGPRPLTLRLPPDRLLFLLLLFQATPSLRSSPNIGNIDVPIPDGLQIQTGSGGAAESKEGDVKSTSSWVGSVLSTTSTRRGGISSWLGGKKQEMDEDSKLRLIFAALSILPSLAIHRPVATDAQIKELVYGESYTSFGGIEIKLPLNVFRSLWELELDGYDPRGVLIPSLPSLKSLWVHDVGDGDDWIDELLQSDFPGLRHLKLTSCNLLSLPSFSLPIVHLDLSSNLLNAIPASLSSLTSLQSLNLSSNMIESVRGAESLLPSIRAINLRNNRIDCLAGLDRVKSLERIDVRGNDLRESDEIGRLAQLPKLKEVWASNNEFADVEDNWRHRVFVMFAEEANTEVALDGHAATWTEKRAIQADLDKRGRRARPREATEHARKPQTTTTQAPPAKAPRVPSPEPSKRRRQRVVDLDQGQDPNFAKLRLDHRPLRESEAKEAPKQPRPSRDERQHASLFDTIAEAASEDIRRDHRRSVTEATTTDEGDPSDVRARIEALRAEAGDNWLQVLASQQQQRQRPESPGRRQEASEETVQGRNGSNPEPIAVQVRKKKSKKAANVGIIT